MTEPTDERRTDLLILVDPAFEPTDAASEPPPESIVGGWAVTADGSRGRFRPNPVHVPSSPEVPSDPVDAVLRLLASGEADGADLLAVLGEIDLAIAVDADATVVAAPAPDGVMCVLATTAPRHRTAAEAAGPPVAGWQEVPLTELAAALPGHGLDLLLNPRGPAPMRIAAVAVQEAARRPSDQSSGLARPTSG